MAAAAATRLRPGRGHEALFASLEDIKETRLDRAPYDVKACYKKDDCFATMAASHTFEKLGLVVIGFHVIWIAVDTDFNDAKSLDAAGTVFQVADYVFLCFFLCEWLIHFLAFEKKMDCFRDGWFMFDSLLVWLMVLDTAGVHLLIAAGVLVSAHGGNVSLLKVVRVVRLTRLARLARIACASPQLKTLVKGILAAMRSVCLTLGLFVGILFSFAILFAEMTKGTAVGDERYSSVSRSMYTLLLHGTCLDEVVTIMDEMMEESILLCLTFLLFVFLTAHILVYMLIGVFCHVVSVVAAAEKRDLVMGFVHGKIETVMEELGVTADSITKEAFVALLRHAAVVEAFCDVGVSAEELTAAVELVWETDAVDQRTGCASLSRCVDLVLQCRGTNTATVKDLMMQRRFFMSVVDELMSRVNEFDGNLKRALEERTPYPAYALGGGKGIGFDGLGGHELCSGPSQRVGASSRVGDHCPSHALLYVLHGKCKRLEENLASGHADLLNSLRPFLQDWGGGASASNAKPFGLAATSNRPAGWLGAEQQLCTRAEDGPQLALQGGAAYADAHPTAGGSLAAIGEASQAPYGEAMGSSELRGFAGVATRWDHKLEKELPRSGQGATQCGSLRTAEASQSVGDRLGGTPCNNLRGAEVLHSVANSQPRTAQQRHATFLSATQQPASQREASNFAPGQRVFLRGVPGRKDLDGQSGTLLTWAADHERWNVGMADGSIKLFRPEHLVYAAAQENDTLASADGFLQLRAAASAAHVSLAKEVPPAIVSMPRQTPAEHAESSELSLVLEQPAPRQRPQTMSSASSEAPVLAPAAVVAPSTPGAMESSETAGIGPTPETQLPTPEPQLPTPEPQLPTQQLPRRQVPRQQSSAQKVPVQELHMQQVPKQQTQETSASSLRVGMRAQFQRMASRPELNGTQGVVLTCDQDWVKIKLDDGTRKRVRARNVVPAEDDHANEACSADGEIVERGSSTLLKAATLQEAAPLLKQALEPAMRLQERRQAAGVESASRSRRSAALLEEVEAVLPLLDSEARCHRKRSAMLLEDGNSNPPAQAAEVSGWLAVRNLWHDQIEGDAGLKTELERQVQAAIAAEAGVEIEHVEVQLSAAAPDVVARPSLSRRSENLSASASTSPPRRRSWRAADDKIQEMDVAIEFVVAKLDAFQAHEVQRRLSQSAALCLVVTGCIKRIRGIQAAAHGEISTVVVRDFERSVLDESPLEQKRPVHEEQHLSEAEMPAPPTSGAGLVAAAQPTLPSPLAASAEHAASQQPALPSPPPGAEHAAPDQFAMPPRPPAQGAEDAAAYPPHARTEVGSPSPVELCVEQGVPWQPEAETEATPGNFVSTWLLGDKPKAHPPASSEAISQLPPAPPAEHAAPWHPRSEAEANPRAFATTWVPRRSPRMLKSQDAPGSIRRSEGGSLRMGFGDVELEKNMRVRIRDLAVKQDLNGKVGKLTGYDSQHQRWKVRLDDGAGQLIRGGHLERLSDDPRDAHAAGVGVVHSDHSPVG